MSAALEQLLADWRGDAAVLRRQGHGVQADQLERRADEVARAAEPWLKKLSLADARLKSGRSIRWLKACAPEWETQGLAGREDGAWWFLDCVIAQRQHASLAREDARRAAHGGGAAA